MWLFSNLHWQSLILVNLMISHLPPPADKIHSSTYRIVYIRPQNSRATALFRKYSATRFKWKKSIEPIEAYVRLAGCWCCTVESKPYSSVRYRRNGSILCGIDGNGAGERFSSSWHIDPNANSILNLQSVTIALETDRCSNSSVASVCFVRFTVNCWTRNSSIRKVGSKA